MVHAILKRENTGQRKHVFSHILCSDTDSDTEADEVPLKIIYDEMLSQYKHLKSVF